MRSRPIVNDLRIAPLLFSTMSRGVFELIQTNKCQHCGSLVPAEKAFCPNCSEPMEPEEKPARETFVSGEMMSTIRDDPENYRQMLMPPVKPPTANTEAKPPVAANRASSVTGYNIPKVAPEVRPPAQTSYVILGISVVAFLILLFIILWILKVI